MTSRLALTAALSMMVAVISSIATPVFATDYHLTPGSDLQATLNSLVAGDIVYLATGEYNPAIANPPYNHVLIQGKIGTPKAWIVIKPEPGAHPILHIGLSVTGFTIQASTYIRVEGLEIAGTSANTSSGITVQSSGGPTHHIQIVNNYVHDMGGNGIDFHCSQMLIEGNRVTSCGINDGAPNGDVSLSGISVWEPTSDSTDNANFAGSIGNPDNAYSIIIRNNTVYGNYDGSGPLNPRTDGNGIILDTMQGGHDPNYKRTRFPGKTLVANNICFNNGGKGVHVFESDNVDVFNNTLWHNQTMCITSLGEMDNEGNNNRFFNNICVSLSTTSSNSTGSKNAGGKNVQFSNNLYFNDALGHASGANDVMGKDPLFVFPSIDGGTANFRLRAGSPARTSGRPVTAAPCDFSGNTRSTTDPTIGAFE